MSRISVAMATCEGARFVSAQLQSILAQTRPPDEVLIFDDVSTDGTVSIARALAAGSPVPVHITVNPSRLGATGNFERAIRACGGDLIVLADQDDVWAPSKLAVVETMFAADPQVGALFSNAELIDGDGARTGGTLWHRVGMSSTGVRRFGEGRGVDVLLRQNVVTGASMAFHSRFCDMLMPLPATGYHDAWIALLVSAVAPVLAIDEPLIEYRLHDANTAGLPARDLLGRIAARRRRARVHEQAESFFQSALDRLTEHGASEGQAIAALRAKIAHLHFRSQLSANPLRRFAPVVAHMARGDYARFSREGPRSAAFDLIYG